MATPAALSIASSKAPLENASFVLSAILPRRFGAAVEAAAVVGAAAGIGQ